MTTDINDVVREKLGVAPASSSGKAKKPRKPKPTVSDQRAAAVSKIVDTLDEALTLADTLQVAFEEALNQLTAEFTPQFEALGNKLQEAVQEHADLCSEIEEKVSNLEEKFSGTERYQLLSEFRESLGSVDIPDGDGDINSFGRDFAFDDALEAVQNAVERIDSAKSELEGIEIP